MAFSKAKRTSAAAALPLAALLAAACQGPSAAQPRPAQPRPASQPPGVGTTMVVYCRVCKGLGSVQLPNGGRGECPNCNGTGKVKYTK